jgi:hypothetical protein
MTDTQELEQRAVTLNQRFLLRRRPRFDLSLALSCRVGVLVSFNKNKRDRSPTPGVSTAAPFVVHSDSRLDVIRRTDVQRSVRAADNVEERHLTTTHWAGGIGKGALDSRWPAMSEAALGPPFDSLRSLRAFDSASARPAMSEA